MSEKYHIHISSKHSLFDLKLDEVWKYRDLIFLFTEKNMKANYKQTILGPAWLFINPLISSVVYMLLFGEIAKLSTDGTPKLLFYLCGTAIWGFFSSCLMGNASTFVSYAYLFGKVYFPRLTIPLSNVLGAVIKLGIQMILVVVLVIYFVFNGLLAPHWWAWPLIILVVIQLGILGMSIGIMMSSVTTKYRDLTVLVSFGVSLWMYATPVVYPMSQLPAGLLRTLIMINPVSMPIELFRYAILGVGSISVGYYVLSWVITLVVAVLGIMLFNLVERNFLDTV
ncbi:MAG: ABC transporter permease [Erysipelotrichaceae bacterium]|nr:ABC transporter permease [Erysipelotrichaceae bacterium]